MFDKANRRHKLKFFSGQLKYGKFSRELDIFQYVENIQLLKKRKNVFFVFDASVEGFSPFKYHFFEILYQNCRKYGVPPQKIIFVSSNLCDEDNLNLFNKKHNINESINVFCYPHFKSTVARMIEDKFGTEIKALNILKQYKKLNQEKYTQKYLLSLSRVNRAYRTFAIHSIFDSNLKNKSLLSHDTMTDYKLNELMVRFGIPYNKISHWKNNLPLIADTDNFEQNHALFLSSNLYHQTLFQVVNETEVLDYNRTSLFYSEKTFKPIAHMQPFLIWGQVDCNRKLETLGFKIYDELFDYDFDSIENTTKRWKYLQRTVESCAKKLDRMSRDKQLEWRWERNDKLIHNFKTLLSLEDDLNKFRKLRKKLVKNTKKN